MIRRSKQFFSRGFTLMEVNLAIFIMAVGVLGMVALYPLGFREGTYSRSDVVEATLADGILGPLESALSSTNMTWSAWKQLWSGGDTRTGLYPNQGWLTYSDANFAPKTYSTINGSAKSVANKLCGVCPNSPQSVINKMFSYADKTKMACALVYSAGGLPQMDQSNTTDDYKDISRVVIALRVSRSSSQLFEAPVFYTEVHFQGQREQQ